MYRYLRLTTLQTYQLPRPCQSHTEQPRIRPILPIYTLSCVQVQYTCIYVVVIVLDFQTCVQELCECFLLLVFFVLLFTTPQYVFRWCWYHYSTLGIVLFLLHTVNAVSVLDEVRVDTLKSSPGSRHRHKRKGRGISAGQGASCGFGMRGQKSRSGPGVRAGFEGGQTALYRRLPKLVGRPMGPGHTKKVSRCMLTEAESGVGVGDRVPSARRNVCCVSQTVQRFGTHIIDMQLRKDA